MVKDKLGQEIMRRFNKNPEIRRMFQNIMPSSPSYRYFSVSGSKDRYFYTTQKINHKGKPRYVAGIYRHLKTRNVFKLVKSVGFAKKFKAIDWARKAKNVAK